MNYLGRVFNNCKYIYNEINAATLTGAIDVVVVEQPDGSYTCSPFHVRFGKLGVLRSKEKIVDIEINDEPVDIHMKLGESGEAFFVEEIEDDCLVQVPPHLACSPIPPEGERFPQFQLDTKSGDRLDFKPIASESSQESTSEFIKDDSPPLAEKGSNGNLSKKKKRRRSTKKKNGQKRNSIAHLEEEVFEIEDVTEEPPKPEKVENLNIEVVKEREIHFFSDTEITPGSSPRDYAPIQSDTEFETKRTEDNTAQSGDEQPQSWRWGELPTSPSLDDNKQETQKWMLQDMLGFMKKTKHIRHESEGKGIYLSDLNYDDPEMAALYFPSAYKQDAEAHKEEDDDSGNGTSLPQSPHSVETFETKMLPDDIGLSLCGLNATPEQFAEQIVSYNDMCQDPVATINNPKLVVKINGKLYTWRSAAPIILSILTFRKTLPQEVVSRLEGDEEEKQPKKPYKSWFNWSRGNTEPEKFGEEKEIKDEKDTKETESKNELENKEEPKDEKDSKDKEIRRPDSIQDLRPTQSIPLDLSVKKDIPTRIIQDTTPELNPDKYRKTLRLTSGQIESLNLKPGANEIVFSVTTAYQGTTRCSCFLFCWRYDDKIVISDIDGTITKSDVLGHILPIVGKDWAQNGVAKLFTNIKNNGYKVLYLSARAIGQSRVTRDYLKSIKQENLSLPEGPMLLNPTSLLNAFHREVIEKKPEEFKISCLKDIQALFPSHITPFYAGFGNKVNDVWSYRAVGVPLFRIFTINHRGELKHELTQTFQSSYNNMSHLVDQMFPTNKSQPSEDFSQFVYWREPIQDIEEAELSSH